MLVHALFSLPRLCYIVAVFYFLYLSVLVCFLPVSTGMHVDFIYFSYDTKFRKHVKLHSNMKNIYAVLF